MKYSLNEAAIDLPEFLVVALVVDPLRLSLVCALSMLLLIASGPTLPLPFLTLLAAVTSASVSELCDVFDFTDVLDPQPIDFYFLVLVYKQKKF